MPDDDNAEMLRLDHRNRVERQPLGRESSLGGALRKVPGKWTRAMCEALHLPVSSRDKERKAAILDYLTSPGSMAELWRDLPEPSRRIVSWLVRERNGSSSVRELYEKFEVDDDSSYHWNKGQLPTTALGLLRLHGLVFKGMASSEWGREKVAVVPVELRRDLESITRGAREVDPAPPMPGPAFRNKSGLREPLEVRAQFWGSGRPDADAYQFMIVLKDIRPTIWRRIQVPGFYSFWDLHVAIQDAMGWLDCHLHEFRVRDPFTGGEVILSFAEECSIEDRKALADYLVPISEYFGGEPVEYLYDFGDSWLHEVTLEAVLPPSGETEYPVCTAGARACPPEDCGGVNGYADFLRIIADPTDEEHEEMLHWVGGTFNPECFNPSAVHFDDYHLRWNAAHLNDEEAYELLMRGREAAAERTLVTHTNRLGDLFFLHSRETDPGSTSYFFSRNKDGQLVSEIPDGYEIHERPDGQVQLRKIPEEIITERERIIVESAVKAAGIEDSIVEVRGDAVTVFLADLDEAFVSRLLDQAGLIALESPEGPNVEEMFRAPFGGEPSEILRDLQGYTPHMRFVLDDPVARTFIAERMCFSGAMDWMFIGGPDHIERVANRFCGHMGKDSFYEL